MHKTVTEIPLTSNVAIICSNPVYITSNINTERRGEQLQWCDLSETSVYLHGIRYFNVNRRGTISYVFSVGYHTSTNVSTDPIHQAHFIC